MLIDLVLAATAGFLTECPSAFLIILGLTTAFSHPSRLFLSDFLKA